MTELLRRRVRPLVTLIVLAISLALSACQVGGTRPIIKIGLMAPFTGFDQGVGYSVIGAVRLAVRERNLAGGVGGYRVELVALDDGNEAAVAAQRAREMIIDPAVMAVLGGFDGSVAAAAGGEYRQAALPFVSFVHSEGLTDGHLVFSLVAGEREVGRRAGEFAVRSLQATRIAIVTDAPVEQDSLGNAFAAAAQAGGATIVLHSQITRWQLDFTQTIRQIAAAAPDLLFFAGRAAEAGELLRQMRAAGVMAGLLGGPGVDDARLVQIAGSAAQGVSYISLGFTLDQVADAGLRRRLSESALRPAGPYTVLAYDGTQLLLDTLAQAIRQNGKPTRTGVAEALRKSRYQGVTGDIAFDAQGRREMAPLNVYRITTEQYPGEVAP